MPRTAGKGCIHFSPASPTRPPAVTLPRENLQRSETRARMSSLTLRRLFKQRTEHIRAHTLVHTRERTCLHAHTRTQCNATLKDTPADRRGEKGICFEGRGARFAEVCKEQGNDITGSRFGPGTAGHNRDPSRPPLHRTPDGQTAPEKTQRE